VPKVRQKPLATARRLLVKAGCRVGKVTAKRARRTRPGRVIDQRTRPGRLVRAGTRVSLDVARKAKPRRRSTRRG
jgi:beta-lactam-binding protein with PASTA domain